MGQKKKEKCKKYSFKNKSLETQYEVSYLQLYSYGTWYELLVTLAGIILGFLSGGAVPFVMALFGELTTAFLEKTTHVERTSYLPMLAIFGGGRQISNGTHEELMAALLVDASALIGGMFASSTLCILFSFLALLMINWSALKQITRIRKLYLRSVLRQDMSWYDTETGFNMASISDEMLKLKEGISEKVGIVANLVGTAVIAICSAIPLGWKLSLACLSVLPFSIASSIALTKYQIRSSVKGLESYSKAGKLAEEVLKSVRTVVAFGGEKKEVARYARLLAPSEQYDRKRGLYTGIATGFNWVLTYSLNSIGVAYGTRLVLQDMAKPTEERDYQVGEILTILFNIYMATQSITFCVPHSESFCNACAAAVSIFQMIERAPKIDATRKEGLAPRRVHGDIFFEDVHFAYPSRPDVKVLNGVSLHIKAGESVALVGPSGCGKSTVLQLIQRLYDPSHGTLKLDGKELTKLNLGWLRSTLGVVGQEPVLFQGTIMENIAIGMPEATFDEVQKVSDIAYAHEFIKNLPQGYDTLIGERGASLSGGQKQRIAIARSLLREPVVLLLDEATSALDPHSERKVQAALDRASASRTTLTVSHRISTIQNANRIICMDQGKVVEEGTYDDLMTKRGFFWKLVTTGKDVKKIELAEALHDDEQNAASDEGEEELQVLEVAEVKNTRKTHQRPSKRRVDWMSPRPSVASVMSSGIQNYLKGFESENDIDNDEDGEVLKSLSNWEILKLNAPEWPSMVIGFIAAFIQGACFPVFAVIFGYAMGMFTIPDHDEILKQSTLYSVMFFVVGTIAGVSMCIQGTTFTSAGLKMTTRLRLQYLSSLLNQEIGYFDKPSNSVGALCSRLSSDTAEVQGATGLCVGLILQGVSSVTIGFLMGVSFNWKLTLVGVALLPIMVGSIWLEGIVSQKSQNDERKAMEAATSIATEAVIGIRTVQSLGIENVFRNKFEDTLWTAIDSVSKKTRWRGLVYGLGIYIPLISYCSATAYGATLVANEGLEYKVVLLVNEAIMYGAYMLGQSLVYAPNFKSAKTCAARILATINRVPNVKSEEGVVDLQNWRATGEIELKDLEFSYPTRSFQKIIQGIDLKVESGKTVALVGPSGCGKSTILQLMQRFYDSHTGNIELDGRDIRFGLTLPRLRQQMGVVQQEPVLLERSLAENIAYGDNSRKVSMQEVVEAARAANIHSFIVSLPKGYETRVGGGTQLSGGQKQRVCIARALVRAPRLLLLDEATSALDAGSERQVAEALLTAAKGRTCVTIAHRLSTVRHADLICVLDKGRIVERGSHEELMALQGHYWRMSRGEVQDTLEG